MDPKKNINGYKITKEFTTVGGGLCRWTFAEKNENTYFLKEFLAPKYPTADSPGSERIKEEKRKKCEEFEKHHLALKKAISSSSKPGGNLVITIDFFREGTTYYKVTEKVDTTSIKPSEISKLPLDQRTLILKTVTHSLGVLHNQGIVHGDLKPENILIKKTTTENYIAKLIDFDNSYFAKSPPLLSEDTDIVGTPNYYSPELGKYILKDKETKTTDLYQASDIYALGVIFCEYLTGSPPNFDSRFKYPWEASANGYPLTLKDKYLPINLVNLINKMLSNNPKERPSAQTTLAELKTWNKDSESREIKTTKLKGTLIKEKKDETPRTGLKGTLTNKK